MRIWRLLLPTTTLVLSAVYLWFAVQPRVPEVVSGVSDVAIHGGGYVVLAVLAALSAHVRGWRAPCLLGWLYAVGHGAVLEVLQYFYPPRQASWLDLGVDAVGAMVGVVMAAAVTRLRQ